MDEITHTQTHDGMLKNAADIPGVARESVESSSSRTQERDFGGDGVAERDGDAEAREVQPKRRRFGLGKKKQSYSHTHYKVYKRRWIGLAQLVLLNIVVSWDVSASFLSLIYGREDHRRIKWLSWL
jgi:FLVCR family MFS transporter 7